MKHITPIIALTALVAASASAQVAPAPKKTALNYDRIGLGWAQNDAVDGLQLSAS